VNRVKEAERKKYQQQLKDLRKDNHSLRGQLKSQKEKSDNLVNNLYQQQQRLVKELEEVRAVKNNNQLTHLKEIERYTTEQAQVLKIASNYRALDLHLTEQLKKIAEEREIFRKVNEDLAAANASYLAAHHACRLASAQLAHVKAQYFEALDKEPELGSGEEYVKKHLAAEKELREYRVSE
jgi:chromosome segregation ATPase